MGKRMLLEDRFWAKVAPAGPDDCWLWVSPAGTGNGYGQIKIDGRKVLAHRHAYESMVGPIPEGLHIDHLCGRRACVNPAHLDPVPLLVNNQRSPGGSNSRAKTHCPHGHPYDEANTYRWRGRRLCRSCRKRGQ